LLPLVLALLAVLLWVAPAIAQSEAPKKPAFGLAPPAAERSAPLPQALPSKADEPRDALTGLWLWIVEGQRELTQAMTGAVRRLKTGDFATSTAVLAAISFLYGVLHAVGPGHGKFVISSYALANERTVRRGIVLSFMAALVQAVSAVLVVGLLASVLQATSLEIRATEAWLESASWGLIALLGAWLLYAQVKPLLHPGCASGVNGSCDDGQPHHRGHSHHRHSESPGSVAALREHGLRHHEACCGHAHVATPSQLDGTWCWTKAWSLALSIGIRPCTGAIAVLLFALSIGLFWAGVFATIAMALGTAITVSTLVAMAVGSRQLATRMAGAESRWAARIQTVAGIGGSALVFILGAAFFVASLHGAGPL
jgi:nickel/cobalt exporter